MKSVAAHMNDCLEIAKPLAPFRAGLADAAGCIVMEDVLATVDVPSSDISACDGYAVQMGSLVGAANEEGDLELPVTQDLVSGMNDYSSCIPGTATRISTGARVPAGADCIIPLSHTDFGTAKVKIHGLPTVSHIRPAGSDMRAGDVICPSGTRLTPRHIALLSASGHDHVLVQPRPRVVIMTIGDDLTFPGRPLPPGFSYDANAMSLQAAARACEAEVSLVPVVSDDPGMLRSMIEDQLLRADVLITTGGLSYGHGDTLKDVLSQLGNMRFDNIAMKPGKNSGIGTIADGVSVYCLPGDPVGALVNFEIFVRPALRKMAGYKNLSARTLTARAESAIECEANVTQYLRVHLHGDPHDGYFFDPIGNPHEQLLTSLAAANGLAIVPEGMSHVGAGSELECIILSN